MPFLLPKICEFKEVTMKAICVDLHQDVESASYQEMDMGIPQCESTDVLVKIDAVAINPVDTKLYQAAVNQQLTDRVLGHDAVGVVIEVGSEVKDFNAGDRVFYAGDMTRPGSFAEYQLVDSDLLAKAPSSFSTAQIAAFPLVSITAAEAIFEKLGVSSEAIDNQDKSILIIGGSGGVGSIAIQLCKLAGLNVIASASRVETIDWCSALGADKVVNHHQPIREQLDSEVDYILCAADTDSHLNNMAESIKPFGGICALVSVANPVDMNLFKNKSVSFHWEFMFTRSLYKTSDKYLQGNTLERIANCIDNGNLKPIDSLVLQGLNAENISTAHESAASGNMRGKCVIVF